MSRVIKKHTKTFDEAKEQLIRELIETFDTCGYKVRMDKGNFKGGFCLLREQKLLLLNRGLEQEKKLNFLIQNLSEIETENIYIKPNIRELIDKEKDIYGNK
jgi:hypothetical protein